MTWEEARAWLDAAQWTGIKLGLERVRSLWDALGRPGEGLRFAHVAGTNGKGSTCAFGESVARAAGLSTGLYTSPHLLDPSERIKLNGKAVSHEEMAEGLGRIREAAAGWAAPPTYFEILTLLALLVFERAKPEVVLWETGMGGRLDATNIIRPAVTVITPIGMDHQQYLGDTLGAIAGEKAGIFKPGVPAVSAPQKEEAAVVLRERAARLGIPLFECAPTDLPPGLRLGLGGPHQRGNAALALAALRLAGIEPSEDAVAAGLAGVCWPARFQRIGGWIVDGAHNPEGAEALAAAWQEEFGGRKAAAVFGVMEDKDAGGILRPLGPILERITLCAVPGFERAADPEAVLPVVRKVLPGVPALVTRDLREALAAGARKEGDLPGLVTGSLYLCAEALRALGWRA